MPGDLGYGSGSSVHAIDMTDGIGKRVHNPI
jgi:hypothetical protein